jgi:hypothetical protein
MKTGGRVLLVAWALLAVGVALIFALPKLASQVLHPIASYFQLIPMILLVATVFYGILRAYRTGIARK